MYQEIRLVEIGNSLRKNSCDTLLLVEGDDYNMMVI